MKKSWYVATLFEKVGLAMLSLEDKIPATSLIVNPLFTSGYATVTNETGFNDRNA